MVRVSKLASLPKTLARADFFVHLEPRSMMQSVFKYSYWAKEIFVWEMRDSFESLNRKTHWLAMDFNSRGCGQHPSF